MDEVVIRARKVSSPSQTSTLTHIIFVLLFSPLVEPVTASRCGGGFRYESRPPLGASPF
jgi:hypothetical protein